MGGRAVRGERDRPGSRRGMTARHGPGSRPGVRGFTTVQQPRTLQRSGDAAGLSEDRAAILGGWDGRGPIDELGRVNILAGGLHGATARCEAASLSDDAAFDRPSS